MYQMVSPDEKYPVKMPDGRDWPQNCFEDNLKGTERGKHYE